MSSSARLRTIRPLCRRCVNCSLSLTHNLRRRTIKELNEQMHVLLRSWIMPTQISSDDILCSECFDLLLERQTLNANETGKLSPAFGHMNVCFGCGITIANRRTHKVGLDCPERDIIMRWAPDHQVPHLQRVCTACWLAARREVQRQTNYEVNHPVEASVGASNMDVDSAVAVIPEPPPQPQQVHITQTQPLRVQPAKITSSIYKRISASSRHCLFSGCENTERLLVPSSLKEILLYRYKIYVPLHARICQYHLYSNEWQQLNAPFSGFTSFQVDDIFSKLEHAAQRQLDFNNIESMDPNICHYWLGLTAENFMKLLESIPNLNTQVKKPKVALSIFLVKRRTGDSNQRLSTLFNLPRTTLERQINIVRNCLNG